MYNIIVAAYTSSVASIFAVEKKMKCKNHLSDMKIEKLTFDINSKMSLFIAIFE
jgi:hypothetical protein